jgi:hypothetical protein
MLSMLSELGLVDRGIALPAAPVADSVPPELAVPPGSPTPVPLSTV